MYDNDTESLREKQKEKKKELNKYINKMTYSYYVYMPHRLWQRAAHKCTIFRFSVRKLNVVIYWFNIACCVCVCAADFGR